jgi:hypothetical protein
MKGLRILGCRVLVRNYSLPDQIGSIIVPEGVRTQFDGKTYEVVAVGDDVAKLVGIGGTRGSEVFPILKDGVDGIESLYLQPDDILILRYQFRGVWAGPEVRDHFGYDCWFIDAVSAKHRDVWDGQAQRIESREERICTISKVIPASSWREETGEDLSAA